MSRTIIQHPDGSRTTIRNTSGCAGCFWTLLAIFLLFAPAAWAGSGSLPFVAAVAMYVVLAIVVIAGIVQRSGRRRQVGPVPIAPMQSWPPPPPAAPPGPVQIHNER